MNENHICLNCNALSWGHHSTCLNCGIEFAKSEQNIGMRGLEMMQDKLKRQAAENSDVQASPLKTQEGGVKFDHGKSPVVRGALQYFPRALSSVAEVSQKGADKYSWKGWETVPDGFDRYSDALGRHLLGEAITDIDEETGCLHASQVAWNALARLELLLKELEHSHE